MTQMKGIILHGGAGTRLRPLTFTGPKQLIPVANKPISQYVLGDLIGAGITDVAIVTGNVYPDKVKEYFGDGAKFGAEISYVHQGEPRGIAHAIGLCKDFVRGERFVTYLGDNLLKGGIAGFVNKFSKEEKMDALILLTKVKDPQRFGVAEFDEEGKLVHLVEKPEKPPSNYSLAGIYLFSPVVFEAISRLKPSLRGELEITEAIQVLLDEGYNVGHDFIEGWWKDTGRPEDILEANRLVLDEMKPLVEGSFEDDSSVQGRICLQRGSSIKKGALVRGPAIIGENTVVHPGAYIGPYSSIGSNCVIRRGEIENSIVMDNCIIDTNNRIADSIIGSNSEITSNAANAPRGRRFILGESSTVML